MSNASGKRLFFALWPPSEVRRQLELLTSGSDWSGSRVTAEYNLHVTLVFLGQVLPNTEQELVRQAGNVVGQSFELRFGQLEFWPKPKVVCLTPYSTEPELNQLVEKLQQITDQCGLQTDHRYYRPHITLARKAKQPVSSQVQPIVWPVNSFVLVESKNLGSGVRYHVRYHWPLS